MKTKIYNLSGKETADLELSDDVFAVEIKPAVVHEVYTVLMGNKRQPWAHTKDRGDVRGGGRKPWAQKGTGRARHGSSRSPIWRGGGVTFGPLSIRNYRKSINKKTRRVALKMCLSDKATDQKIFVIENFDFPEIKTKLFVDFIGKLPVSNDKILLVTDGKDDKVLRLSNNLKNTNTVRVEDLSVVEVLSKPNLVISQEAIKKLEERLLK